MLTVELIQVGPTSRAAADKALFGEPAKGVVDSPDTRSVEQAMDVCAGELGVGESKHAEHVAIEGRGDDRERS